MNEYEREFFSIEGTGTNKIFHYHGFTWQRDGLNGFEYASTELTFCQEYLDELLETGIDYFMQTAPETIQQYQGDYTEEGIKVIINNYYNGEPGEELHIADITEDTPAGNYWCYSE